MKTLTLALLSLLFYSSNGQNPVKTEKEMIAEIELEAKPAYVKAYADVFTIRQEINLAKKGKLSKIDVVKHYNDIFSPIMGYKSTLTDVDKRIKSSGDGYVKFMYKKEMARIAALKVAESQYKLETLKRQK